MKEEGPIRAVVFDLFHTLVDPQDFSPRDFRRPDALADLIGTDRAKFSAYWKMMWRSMMSSPKPEAEYLREFVARSGRTLSKSTLDEAESILERYQRLAILNPRKDVVPALRLLRAQGYKLGLLSNTFESDVRGWTDSPLARCFDAVAFSHEIGIMKPELGAYMVVLERLGLDPSACIFVGDGGSDELLGARRAGFVRVAFMRRFVSSNGLRNQAELEDFAKQSDFSIDSLEELCSRVSLG